MGTKALKMVICGDTVDELRERIRVLAKEFGIDTGSTQLELPVEPRLAVAAKHAETLESSDTEPSKKRGPGRPPKKSSDETPPAKKVTKSVDVEVEESPEEPTALDTDTESPAQITRDAAAESLKELNSKKGLPVCRTILGKFKANRFSELKDSDLGPFVQACQVALRA